MIEKYPRFNLRKLKDDFPSLIESNNNREKQKSRHGFGECKPNVNPLSAIIIST